MLKLQWQTQTSNKQNRQVSVGNTSPTVTYELMLNVTDTETDANVRIWRYCCVEDRTSKLTQNNSLQIKLLLLLLFFKTLKTPDVTFVKHWLNLIHLRCIYLQYGGQWRVVVLQLMKHVGCNSSFHRICFTAWTKCWRAVVHDVTSCSQNNPKRLIYCAVRRIS